MQALIRFQMMGLMVELNLNHIKIEVTLHSVWKLPKKVAYPAKQSYVQASKTVWTVDVVYGTVPMLDIILTTSFKENSSTNLILILSNDDNIAQINKACSFSQF